MSSPAVHVVVANNVVFHNPAQPPLHPGAGVAIVPVTDTTGKTVTAHGQINAGGPIPGPTFNNPGV